MQNPRGSLLLGFLFLSVSLQAADPVPGKQVERELRLADGQSIPYLLYVPAGAAPSEAGWPLLLFLHGRGESFGPLSLVKKWGPPRQVEMGMSLPFILVSPQCPEKESWSQPRQQALLVALLDQMAKEFKVDPGRVYLSGLSLGGYGSWRLAADHPERFAAVIPICGGGRPEDASKLKDLPIWVWHGTEDKAVPLQKSVEMVEAIKAAGGIQIRFTTLEGIGHNAWEAAYASPELYEWMNRQQKTAHSGGANQ